MAEPVALGVQVPDSFKTIGSMLGMANSAQNLQRGNIELQQNQIKLQERKGIQDLFSNPQQFIGEDGRFSYDKFIPKAMEVAPTTFPSMAPQIIQAHRAGIDAEKAINELDKDKRAASGQFILSLVNDDPTTGFKKLDALSSLSPQLKKANEFFKQFMLTPASQQGPEAWKNAVMQVGRMVMTPTEQKTAMTPSGIDVTNNQQSSTKNTNPFYGPIGADIPGTLQQKELPPTTEIFNAANNTKEFLGPQPKSQWLGPEPKGQFQGDAGQIRSEINAIKDPATRAEATRALQNQMGGASGETRQPLQAAPALGQEKGVEGTVATVNKDWDDTVAAATRAPTDIGVMQNIKKYAPGAQTGVLSDRRAFIQGLADLFGIDAAKIGKTDTDLLIKNSNMAALGGNTDAMRTLLESANPNVKMNEKAIIAAADQLIAQKKLMVAKQQFMLPFKTLNDPNVYSRALSTFNSAADPRILQIADMSEEELTKMKAAMNPRELTEFREKIRKLKELGIVK